MASRLFARRTATVNGKGIEVGSVVSYSRDFLRSTGQYTGTAPVAEGTVTVLQPFGQGTSLAVIDWGKDKEELPNKVLTSNLILNSNRHLELASKKKATTLVSKQTLEQAVQEAQILVEQFVNSNAHDARLDQLEEAISFLTNVLKKSPVEMQQEGAATLDDYLDDAVMPEMAQKIKQDVDMIAKMKNAGTEGQEAAPVLASSSDFISDRDEKGEPQAPELAEVPRLASSFKNADLFYGTKKAAPVLVPTKAPAANPDADIQQLSSDVLAKMLKALSTAEDLYNDKAANKFIGAIADELADRPVEVKQEKAPTAPAAGAPPTAAPLPMAASVIGGLIIAADEEGNTKLATSQGGAWFVTDKDTGTIKEDGGRTPEIGKAHGMVDDNTGIKRPATELPSKFAEDMSTGSALKKVEKAGEELKALYLDIKKVTKTLDSRPVREAVESVYRAYDMFGEAAKVLNKQRMQEEAEEQALEVKEKNKKKSSSVLFGLTIASDDEDDEEGYRKCANCEHEKDEHKNGKCTKCDCTKWDLDSPHKE
jgi:hypothetical protein